MGMYTALSLGIELKEKTPQDVIDVLKFMIDGPTDEQMPAGLYPIDSAQQFSPPTDGHVFFECPRWTMLFNCDSYYFDWQTGWELYRDDLYPKQPHYYLTGVSNLKNYNHEIRKFLDWILPYIETNGFLGWTQYEEDEHPTIIYSVWSDLLKRSDLNYVQIGGKL